MPSANHKKHQAKRDDDRLRDLYLERLEYATRRAVEHSATPEELAEIEHLSKLLEMRRAERLRSLRNRAPLVVSFFGSVLLFAGLASCPMPKVSIDMEATATTLGFRLPTGPGDVPLAGTLQASGLVASNLTELDALFVTGKAIPIPARNLTIRPTTGFDSQVNVTFGELRAPGGSDVALEIDGSGNLLLSIDPHGRRIEMHGGVLDHIVATAIIREALVSGRTPPREGAPIGFASTKRIALKFLGKYQVDFSAVPAGDLQFVRTDESFRSVARVPTEATSLTSAKITLRALAKEISLRDDALGFAGMDGGIKHLTAIGAQRNLVLRYAGSVREMRTGDLACVVSEPGEKASRWKRLSDWFGGDSPLCRSLMPSRLEYMAAQSSLIAVWTGAACLIAFFLSILKWLGLER